MTTAARDRGLDLPGSALQFFGFFGGILAWKLQLMTIYALVPFACWRELVVLIHLASLSALLLALGAAAVSWRGWARSGARADTEQGGPIGRTRFVGLAGAVLDLFFALMILGQWLPNLFLSPCDGIS